MPNYNFVAGSYHTNKLSSRLSSSEVRFYTKTAFFRFFLRFARTNSAVWTMNEMVSVLTPFCYVTWRTHNTRWQ